MQPILDGTYSIVVVDAIEDTARGGVSLDLVITDGTAKGEVVTVFASSTPRSAIDLLGLPATLEVRDGRPHVRFES